MIILHIENNGSDQLQSKICDLIKSCGYTLSTSPFANSVVITAYKHDGASVDELPANAPEIEMTLASDSGEGQGAQSPSPQTAPIKVDDFYINELDSMGSPIDCICDSNSETSCLMVCDIKSASDNWISFTFKGCTYTLPCENGCVRFTCQVGKKIAGVPVHMKIVKCAPESTEFCILCHSDKEAICD